MKPLLNLDKEDSFNLSPMSYPWAYNMYKRARHNAWNPEEVNMGKDIEQYLSLSDDEREMFLDVFATLTTADMAVQQNLVQTIYNLFSPPEIRLWLGHQIADESLHSSSYQHIIECLSLPENEVYERYKIKHGISQKFIVGEKYAHTLSTASKQLSLGVETVDIIESIIIGTAFFYLGWEGIWFYHGFTPILSLGRRGILPGTISQLLYIARDEVTHVAFGVALLRALRDQYGFSPRCKALIQHAVEDAVNAEIIFAGKCIPNVQGYNASIHSEHAKYMADYRLSQIGIPAIYGYDKPVCTWLSEMLESKKERNFFETKVTEYRSSSSLTWD